IDGKTLRVKKNARNVLDLMRPRGELLWIDTVCIDQGNTKERNHQVSMMRDIYSIAQTVYVWLGRGTPASRYAMDTM
ncbi:heterokaryon incompatibility, partial [Cladorrhinum sp. PSN332]